jgi:ATP-dependent Clp protease adaptor protein ClpS
MSDSDTITTTETSTRIKVKQPSMWKVILHNDDFTPMDFVMAVLVQIFHKSETEAYDLMMTVHTKNKAVVGLYTKEIAQTKVSIVDRAAAEHNHPLKTTAEEA